MKGSELFELLEAVGIEKLRWNSKHTDIVGLCPFHSETRSSFAVSEEKLLYNCYSCHARGYLDQMVARLKDMPSYAKARQFIAKFGDYDTPEFSVETLLFGGERPVTDNIRLVSVAMYAPYVTRKNQAKAREYLENRGVIYRKTGIPKCGIEFGYDPEQKRVLFPWNDDEGFYGCEGRLLKSKAGLSRYMPYFGLQKAHHLFIGIEPVPKNCTGFVLVESSIDAIVVSQLYERTGRIGIALGKCSASFKQEHTLRKIGGPFIVGLDNDTSGSIGTEALVRRLTPYCSVDAAVWPEKDPSRCTKKQILIAMKRASGNWI